VCLCSRSLICIEGRIGRENTTPMYDVGEALGVAAAAGGTHGHHAGLDQGHEIADLGHVIADLGREITDQGYEIAGQGRETEVAVHGHKTEADLAAVIGAERVRRGTEVVGCRPVGNKSVHGQQGQGQGQSLRRLQGHRGEFKNFLCVVDLCFIL